MNKLQINKWESLFIDYLDLIEFSLMKDDIGFWLKDRQEANLGYIQDERFWHAQEMFERLDMYTNDYIVTPLSENYEAYYESDCPYDTYQEWVDNKYNLKELDAYVDLTMLEMMCEHYNDIDLDNVYQWLNRKPVETPQKAYEEFISLIEQTGWDGGIEYLNLISINEEIDKQIQTLCNIYKEGYKVMNNYDPDDGLCFEIRQFAIQHIIEILEKLINKEN